MFAQQPRIIEADREMGVTERRFRLQSRSSLRLSIYWQKCVFPRIKQILVVAHETCMTKVHCSIDYLVRTSTSWTKRDDSRRLRVSTRIRILALHMPPLCTRYSATFPCQRRLALPVCARTYTFWGALVWIRCHSRRARRVTFQAKWGSVLMYLPGAGGCGRKHCTGHGLIAVSQVFGCVRVKGQIYS